MHFILKDHTRVAQRATCGNIQNAAVEFARLFAQVVFAPEQRKQV
jgi:hypothetical protein